MIGRTPAVVLSSIKFWQLYLFFTLNMVQIQWNMKSYRLQFIKELNTWITKNKMISWKVQYERVPIPLLVLQV